MNLLMYYRFPKNPQTFFSIRGSGISRIAFDLGKVHFDSLLTDNVAYKLFFCYPKYTFLGVKPHIVLLKLDKESPEGGNVSFPLF